MTPGVSTVGENFPLSLHPLRGLSREELRDPRLAATLHDVGKITEPGSPGFSVEA